VTNPTVKATTAEEPCVNFSPVDEQPPALTINVVPTSRARSTEALQASELALPVRDAIVLMSKWTLGQRKNGLPAETHPLDVWQQLLDAGVKDNVAQSASLLHDVLEDNAANALAILSEIRLVLGAEVAAMVQLLSDDPTLTREERYLEQLRKMACATPAAQAIKLADRLCVLAEPGLSPARRLASARHAQEMLKVIEQNTLDSHELADAHGKLALALRKQIQLIAEPT
jgi:(p)ppGpp synthase/HD superfamily hydrolase